MGEDKAKPVNGKQQRRVNPMLLLGADAEKNSNVESSVVASSSVQSSDKPISGSKPKTNVNGLLSAGRDSQPALVETSDFDEVKSSPARLNVNRKAVNGLNPFPPKRNPEGENGEQTFVEEVSPPVDNEKHVFSADTVVVVEEEEVKVNKVVVTPPLPGRKNIPVLPGVEVKSVQRKVNPLFMAGEEKEYVDVEAAKAGKERVLRPNFIITGEREDVAAIVLPKRNVRKPFTVLPEGEAKPRSQYSRKIDSQIESEEWTDDTSTDTSVGLGGEKDDYKGAQYSKGFHLTERDVILIRFLARYRYAYVDQLARLVDSTPRTVGARLRKLEERGFVRKELIAGRQYLWVSRKAGNALVDISFNEIKKGSLSYATVAHTIGLANLGVEFEREAGGKDLFGEGKDVVDWVMPENRWKFGIWGHPDGRVLGEMTVSEREIRQGQLRWRGGRSSKEMRELVSLAAANSDPVELEEGQEGLFVIYGQGGSGGEHIPDLVVARERDENGRPQHVAIELELTAKTFDEWRKVLRNFRDNGMVNEDNSNSGMYSKLVYFTHKRSIANGLRKADEEVGLGDKLVIRKYSPSNNSNLPFWG